MIPTQVEVLTGLYGAWRLARLDRRGMGFFDDSTSGLIKSFFAAALVAPGFILLMALYLPASVLEAGISRLVVVLTIAYVLSWTVFPVMVHQICLNIGKDDRFAAYIVAINWARVVQTAVLLPIAAIAQFELLGSGIGNFLNTATYILILVYFWFVSRTALDIGGFAAAGFLLLDVITSEMIFAIAQGML